MRSSDEVQAEELAQRLTLTIRDFCRGQGPVTPYTVIASLLHVAVDLAKFCKVPVRSVKEIVGLLAGEIPPAPKAKVMQ